MLHCCILGGCAAAMDAPVGGAPGPPRRSSRRNVGGLAPARRAYCCGRSGAWQCRTRTGACRSRSGACRSRSGASRTGAGACRSRACRSRSGASRSTGAGAYRSRSGAYRCQGVAPRGRCCRCDRPRSLASAAREGGGAASLCRGGDAGADARPDSAAAVRSGADADALGSAAVFAGYAWQAATAVASGRRLERSGYARSLIMTNIWSRIEWVC